jgi:predicted DCC family thiol-disulfide oxidoreductase YuxK
MPNESGRQVSNPPPRPLLIWDGECHFCRMWVERWRVITAGAIDDATFQEVADRFPEIAREDFQRSVVFVDTAGETFFAAEAVYRSLQSRPSRRWLAWSYDHVPAFAAISELFYKLIARNRAFASALTRVFWGKDVRPPTYFWARRWFLRALGLIYLIAFASLWLQIDGLVGSDGILPIGQFLATVRAQLGPRALSILPTLCWFDSSNAFLHFQCAVGVVISLVLIAGIAPALCLAVLFVFYLSLTIAGQTFLSFQWDILLLEAGFFSIFLAPCQLWPRRISVAAAVSAANTSTDAGDTPATTEPPVSGAAIFLLKFLLFKLMVMSGVVKLTSGDACWWDLTALDYHYWSQPLPTVFGWWADQHPEWFKHFSVAFCLVVEIVVPIFIWAPRRLRLLACALLVFLQLVIALTGNYCFFNLLTIALCLLLIDDASLAVSLREPGMRRIATRPQRLSIYAAAGLIIVTLPLNAWLIYSSFKPDAQPPSLLDRLDGYLERFRIANGYGLFRVMTKDRKEIVIEGSSNGIDWLPYEFKWKPGDIMRAPRWCAPHQPRLDWQMWFAALGSTRDRMWFQGLVYRLLQGKTDVTGLFAGNPFPENPPRYIRATYYRYRFTTAAEHRQTGAWWKRQELGEYLPSVSLDQFR